MKLNIPFIIMTLLMTVSIVPGKSLSGGEVHGGGRQQVVKGSENSAGGRTKANGAESSGGRKVLDHSLNIPTAL